MNTDHCYNASVDGGGNVTVDLYINASMEDEELCSSSCIEGSVDMDPVDSVDNMEDSVDMDVEDSVSMNMEVSVDIVMEVSVNLDMEDSVDIDTEDTLINGREPLEEIATASDILSNLDEEEMIMLFLPAIMGFYDKSGKPAYNCLAAIDYRKSFATWVFSAGVTPTSPCGTSRKR
ncbi:hypothetical protein PR002_g5169 [Phytophthora rubi]|uniref:Uncharacterized protein n=1 Tax=Phytophthora rubi TaxID=129364 RepID=A0A6A3NEK2_9STRA|nr:hypothetical protein PR002_g5169 [Phytophthora rubi]